jgi:hypothetical protein
MLDAWIIAETARGTIDTLYRYWLLGQAARSVEPPRWSVLRNVLGWDPRHSGHTGNVAP